jgi:hypothetical protein
LFSSSLTFILAPLARPYRRRADPPKAASMADDSSHPQKQKRQNDFGNDEQKPPKKMILPRFKASWEYKQEQKRRDFEKLSPEEQEASIAKCKAEEETRIAMLKAKEELEAKKKEQRSLFRNLLRERPDLRIQGIDKVCNECLRLNYSRYWCPHCPCRLCKGDDHMADWCPRKKKPWRETPIPEPTFSLVPFEVAHGHLLSSSRPEAIKEKNQKRLKRFRGIRSSILAPGNDDLAKYLTISTVRYHHPITTIPTNSLYLLDLSQHSTDSKANDVPDIAKRSNLQAGPRLGIWPTQ